MARSPAAGTEPRRAGRVTVALGCGISLALLILMPLPSLRDLLGVDIPIGLDPVNVLVAAGLVLAATAGAGLPLIRDPRLAVVIGINLEILFIAWYRTYGQDAFAGGSLAVFGHSVVVLLAGMVAVQLLGREVAGGIVGLGIAIALFVVGLSMIADLAGLYTPPVSPGDDRFGVKPNGGLMLHANDAGDLLGTFSVPAYLLLRSAGLARIGIALLLFCAPVIVIANALESVMVFVVALAALALLERKVTARALALAAVAALSLLTIATPQTVADAWETPNHVLSGRPEIWDEAGAYLESPQRLAIGGGLDDFQRFVENGRLQRPFTTHNEALRLLVDGGVPMLLAYAALIIALWQLATRTRSPAREALQIAILCSAVLGIVKDVGFFTRSSSWLWALAALALVLPAESRARAGARAARTPGGTLAGAPASESAPAG